MLVLAFLVLGFATLDTLSRFVVVWLHLTLTRPCLDVTTWDASPWCWLLCACLSSFPLRVMICLPCLFMPLVGFLCIFTNLLTCSCMSLKSCLLVCHPYFNTMKLWTSDLNLHLSLVDTTFCLLSCSFVFFLFCLLACLPSCFLDCLFISWLVMSPTICYAYHVYHAYLLYASFICSLHLFLPLLVCWFFVLAFACTHMERGSIELGHGLPGESKKGKDASLLI